MKTEVVLRVHGVAERHIVNARNSHSAAGMALQRLSPRICRLHDVQIVTVIGMPTGGIMRGAFHGDHQHATHKIK
jgi:hypothetical protein